MTVYRFRGVSKPVKTWGKERGQTIHGDCLGLKRVEWVEQCSSCFEIYLVELSNGEKFQVRENDWRSAEPALNFQAKKFLSEKN